MSAVDDRALAEAVRRVTAVALALPEAHEEDAWVGVRWRIRQQTFAHVLPIRAGRPEGHARAAGTDGPALMLTVRAEPDEAALLLAVGVPFVALPHWGTMVGLLLAESPDWDEVAELVTDSYCVQAPRRLAALVDRPSAG
ncbi:hypothetical protein NPS01_41620 [Nocardioides psychrotolerans]|uniref:YjbR protein n=1 Tax=Nocardioides psychrotolerans TaxID=1005945 RepID=A0A1I3GBH0_9ACTN|nr:MmcQ/YjbR family DNA-binding protein [Nocardioides psychrotolerans]GEP40499.1 hypothetical protein NPS01_41620 [Nocardioides psychrotolerans]SFI20803.1 YjbR protein [Nocardioides psychrotolerans]